MSLMQDSITLRRWVCRQRQRVPAHLVVQGTDVQRRVSRGVLCTHIGAVEEEVLQMLDMPVSASLSRNAFMFWLLYNLGKHCR